MSKKRNEPLLLSFLISSLLLLRCLAQSIILVHPSPSALLSAEPPMISIRRSRSEKLLSLKANPKSPSEAEPPRVESDSISVLGSNRSEFDPLIILLKPWIKKPAAITTEMFLGFGG